ncbi:hypothetical protein [Streptomyces anulatus]|uniref:hypothetical protein n=1 Tax=Streptomyces anulatus TaxID=1892 RepID=UPI002ED5AA33|nr:hypothetical protein OG882_04645 [Streptomyces anulatus]WUD92885.1 hypothetical protein OG703_33995 [Streptomyces anulatus]
MNDEQEQPADEVIIWGYKYTCKKCEAHCPTRETIAAAQEDQLEHRNRTHSGMQPDLGDPVEKVELRREPPPSEPTPDLAASKEGESSGGGGWMLLVVILVIAYLASK